MEAAPEARLVRHSPARPPCVRAGRIAPVTSVCEATWAAIATIRLTYSPFWNSATPASGPAEETRQPCPAR